jgi:hypothetical protein
MTNECACTDCSVKRGAEDAIREVARTVERAKRAAQATQARREVIEMLQRLGLR